MSTDGEVWRINKAKDLPIQICDFGRIMLHDSLHPLIHIGNKNDDLLLQTCILKSKCFLDHWRQTWSAVLLVYYVHVHLLSQRMVMVVVVC